MDHININRWLPATVAAAHEAEVDCDAVDEVDPPDDAASLVAEVENGGVHEVGDDMVNDGDEADQSSETSESLRLRQHHHQS